MEQKPGLLFQAGGDAASKPQSELQLQQEWGDFTSAGPSTTATAPAPK